MVYVGFLAPPFEGLALRHVPLNYAARRPEALLDLLPTARAVVLTDQQDAPVTNTVANELSRYVTHQGGKLLFFCYWSAAWGRGFFDTYASIAHSPLPELLPLAFRRSAIQTTQRLRLHGPGEQLWADLPWPAAPAIDYKPADLRPGAIAWATASLPDDPFASDHASRSPRQPAVSRGATDPTGGDVLAASWSVGHGRVVAIGLDAFGFGHGTLVHWPGQRPLLRRALDALLRGEQA